MKKLLIASVFGAFLFGSSYTTLNFKPNKLTTIVLDAGHGGKDPGCIGKQCMEKDVAMSVVYELGVLIKRHHKDVTVIYTRNSDEFIELRERARQANKSSAHLFISVHCNAAATPDKVGGEVYVSGFDMGEDVQKILERENLMVVKNYEKDYQKHYSKELEKNPTVANIIASNSYQMYKEQSIRLGRNIKRTFETDLKRKFIDVKQANFIVLSRSAMPAVLVEIGFMTNEGEESFMASEKGQSHYANALYKSIRDYKFEIERR
ncbi:MAG: N-acetylmuramoyl-L-alanine amidase family protein [Thermoflexibacteraceae bacterium]|jgi:N-acetylmuramoyl-L-alanine amidase